MSILSNVHIYKKTANPTSAPLEVGQHWINTSNGNHYLSNGTSGPSDWVLITNTLASEANSVINNFICDNSVVVGDLLTMDPIANHLVTVTNNAIATIPNGIFGVCHAKPTAGTADVLTMGIFTGVTGLSAAQPVFVSTTGTVTHTIPSTGVVQQIGFSKSATSYFINLLTPIHRG